MDHSLIFLLTLISGVVVGVMVSSYVKAAETSFLGDMHALVAKGVLTEEHVVEYVEATTARIKADVEERLLDVAKKKAEMPVAPIASLHVDAAS